MYNQTSPLELSHFPVMLDEVIKICCPIKNGTYIDCTFGGGGYSKKLLQFPDTKVIAIDRDKFVLSIAQELQKKYPNIEINKEFEENDNTIDEAINIGKYLVDNNSNNVIIITSNWHMNRVKYLFEKVFELIDNVKIEYIETDENEIELEKEEKIKLYNLKHKPYGKWKEYILNTYSDNLIN